MPQLNFVVPMTTILQAYALLLALALLTTQFVILALREADGTDGPTIRQGRTDPVMGTA
jgi:hypothetical protein